MPGAMHRMGVYLGLVEEDESAYADGYAQGSGYGHDQGYARDQGYAEAASGNGYAHGAERGTARRDEYAETRQSRDTVVRYGDSHDVVEPRPVYDQPGYQITALHPRTYNEARTIGEHFRSNTPVIMNLSEMDDADAKRLVDFAAGLTFGLHGRIERVTAKVFLLSPHNVTVTAQDRARMAENGFFNQS